MDKITFCIPSKSNVRYLKTCIPSIRSNSYRKDHDIIVFVDSDEDGTVEWLEDNKKIYNLTYFINPEIGKKLYGIGKAYDFCIEKSNTEIFMIFHADMILGQNADYNCFKHLTRDGVVCATRIEPPLHPNAGEKILLDFGIWPEKFDHESFNKFVVSKLKEEKISEGIFAPWMMYKDKFLEIGGHDAKMHSCREDSDIFNRLALAGFNFVQSWSSLVYHFTGRGAGSFDGDKERHQKWKMDMHNSTKEFIRKWGSNVLHTPLMKPIIPPKYNIGFIVRNANYELLQALEPWCDTILIDDEMQVITTHYLDKEQPNTTYDLSKKILTTPFTKELNNDIVVTVDRQTFNQETYNLIQNLSQIIQQSGTLGKFELGNLGIYIKALNEYQTNLIKL